MNEQAIQDAYLLFKGKGYKKGIEEFKTLMATNPQALNDAFILFQGKGYKKGIEDFSVLMGVGQQQAPDLEKKSTDGTTELSLEDGSLGPSEALDESKKRSKNDLVDDGTFLKDNYDPDTWQHDLGVTLDNLKRASPGGTFAEASARFMYEAIDDMARAIGTGNNQRDLAAVGSDFLYTSDINDFTDEQIQGAIDAYENLGSIGPSDAMMNWQKVYEEEEDPGLVSFIKAFWENPRIATELAVSSMAAVTNPDALKAAGAILTAGTAKGATVGSAGGPAGTGAGAIGGGLAALPTAWGVANGLTEASSVFVELLKERVGPEWDVEKIRKYLSDEDNYNELRRKAATKGGVVAIIDAFGAKVGATAFRKINKVKPTSPKLTPRIRRVLGTAAVAGIEGGAGAGGEALSQLAIGREVDLGETMLEGFGELGFTGITIASAGLKTPNFSVNGIRKTEAEFNDYLRNARIEDIAAADILIEGDGKEAYEQFVGEIKSKADRKNEAAEMYPSLSEEELNEVAELETELKKIENKTTRSAKNRQEVLRARIDDITSSAEEVRKQTKEKPGVDVKEKEVERRSFEEVQAEIDEVDAQIEENQSTISELRSQRAAAIKEASNTKDFTKPKDILAQITEERQIGVELRDKKKNLLEEIKGLEPVKKKEDAVQEQETTEVPVRDDSELGKKVEEEVPTTEPEKPAEQLDIFAEEEKKKDQESLLKAFDGKLKSRRSELRKEVTKEEPNIKRVNFLMSTIESLSDERRGLLVEMGLAQEEGAKVEKPEVKKTEKKKVAEKKTTERKKKKVSDKPVVAVKIDDQITQLEEDLKVAQESGNKKEATNIKRRITIAKKKRDAQAAPKEPTTEKTEAKANYSAVFVDVDAVKSKYGQVHENLYSHHSTIKYRPESIEKLPVGKKMPMKVVGRLTTDKVDVLVVENPLSTNKYPHITLSTAKGVKPSESNNALAENQDKIVPLDDTLDGVVGFVDANRKDITTPPKKGGKKLSTSTAKLRDTKGKKKPVPQQFKKSIEDYLAISTSEEFRKGDSDAIAKYRKLFAAAKKIGRELGLSETEQTSAMTQVAQAYKPKKQPRRKSEPTTVDTRLRNQENFISKVTNEILNLESSRNRLSAEKKDLTKINQEIKRKKGVLDKASKEYDDLILERRKRKKQAVGDVQSYFDTEARREKRKEERKAGISDLFLKRRESAVRSQVKRAQKALSKVLPDLKFVVHKTPESYLKAIEAYEPSEYLGVDANQKREMTKLDSGTYLPGKTPEIHINLELSTLTTVPHEVFHAVLADRLSVEDIVETVGQMLPVLKKIGKVDLLKRLDEFSNQYITQLTEGKYNTAEEVVEALEEAEKKDHYETMGALSTALFEGNEEFLVEFFGEISANYENLSVQEKSAIRKFIDRLLELIGLKKAPEGFSENDKAVINLMNSLSDSIRQGKVIEESQFGGILGSQGAGRTFEQASKRQASINAEILGARKDFLVGKSTEAQLEYFDNLEQANWENFKRVSELYENGDVTINMLESREIDWLQSLLASEKLYDKLGEKKSPDRTEARQKRKNQRFKYIGDIRGKKRLLDMDPVSITEKPVGSFLDQQDGIGICDGTCGLLTTRLENAGLPFGEAHIPDIRANYHAVALTIINGERYILDQPQSEFIGQAIKEAPLYERAMYYGGAAVRFNRHFPDGMNTIMNAFDGDPFSAIIGTYEDEEFGDFGPYFDVTSRENKVKKDSQGGDIDVITAVKKNDPSVTIKIEVESGVDESSLSEENVINLKSFKQGEEALVFTDNKLTPRLIKANKENLIREYGLTTREALIGMQQINEAAIKSSLEERKRQFFAYVTWDSEPEINTKGSFSQYLDYLEQIFPKSITKQVYNRGTRTYREAIERGDFAGFPSKGPLFGYPKGRFLDYPRGKFFTLDEKYAEEYGVPVPAMLDIRNPYIDMTRGIADMPDYIIEGSYLQKVEGKLTKVEGDLENRIVSPRYIKKYLPSYDAVMGTDIGQVVPDYMDPTAAVAVVFNSKQVHILGTKKDIEGFSKYMSREGIDKDIEEGSTSRRKRQFKKIDEEDYNEIDRLYIENLKKDYAKAMSEGIEALNTFRSQAVKTHRQVYGSLNAGPDFPFAEISSPSLLKKKLDSYGIEDIEKSSYLTDYTTESELTQVDEVKEREALAQLYYYSDFIEGDYLTENEKLFQDVYAQEGLRRRQNFYDSRGSLNYDNVVVKGDIILPIGISGSGKSTWIKTLPKEFNIVSPDDIRRELTGDVSDQSRNREVFEEVDKRIDKLLEEGKKVVLDATNLNTGLRKKFMDRINAEFPDKTITYKIIPVNTDVAKERVAKDISLGVDRSNVPDFVIDRQKEMFEETMKSLDSENFSNNVFRGEEAYNSEKSINIDGMSFPIPYGIAETDDPKRKKQNFVGYKGIKKLSDTNDAYGLMALKAYFKAVNMERVGMDRQSILNATSWQKAKDGKWRYSLNPYRISVSKGREFLKYHLAKHKLQQNLEKAEIAVQKSNLPTSSPEYRALKTDEAMALGALNAFPIEVEKENIDYIFDSKSIPLYKMYEDDFIKFRIGINPSGVDAIASYGTLKDSRGDIVNHLMLFSENFKPEKDESTKDFSEIGMNDFAASVTHELQHFIQELEGFSRGASNSPFNFKFLTLEFRNRALKKLTNEALPNTILKVKAYKDIQQYAKNLFGVIFNQSTTFPTDINDFDTEGIFAEDEFWTSAAEIFATDIEKQDFKEGSDIHYHFVEPLSRIIVKSIIKSHEINYDKNNKPVLGERKGEYATVNTPNPLLTDEVSKSAGVFLNTESQSLMDHISDMMLYAALNIDLSTYKDYADALALVDDDDILDTTEQDVASSFRRKFLKNFDLHGDMLDNIAHNSNNVIQWFNEVRNDPDWFDGESPKSTENYFNRPLTWLEELSTGQLGFKDTKPLAAYNLGVYSSYVLSFGEGEARFTELRMQGGKYAMLPILIDEYLIGLDEEIRKTEGRLGINVEEQHLYFSNNRGLSPRLPIPPDIAKEDERKRKKQNFVGLNGIQKLVDKDNAFGIDAMNNYYMALNMKNKVKDSPENILNVTGWQEGKDGKWRYSANPYDIDVPILKKYYEGKNLLYGYMRSLVGQLSKTDFYAVKQDNNPIGFMLENSTLKDLVEHGDESLPTTHYWIKRNDEGGIRTYKYKDGTSGIIDPQVKDDVLTLHLLRLADAKLNAFGPGAAEIEMPSFKLKDLFELRYASTETIIKVLSLDYLGEPLLTIPKGKEEEVIEGIRKQFAKKMEYTFDRKVKAAIDFYKKIKSHGGFLNPKQMEFEEETARDTDFDKLSFLSSYKKFEKEINKAFEGGVIETILGKDNPLLKAYPALKTARFELHGRDTYQPFDRRVAHYYPNENLFTIRLKKGYGEMEEEAESKFIDKDDLEEREEAIGGGFKFIEPYFSNEEMSAFISGAIQKFIQNYEGFSSYESAFLEQESEIKSLSKEKELQNEGVFAMFLNNVPERISIPFIKTLVKETKRKVDEVSDHHIEDLQIRNRLTEFLLSTFESIEEKIELAKPITKWEDGIEYEDFMNPLYAAFGEEFFYSVRDYMSLFVLKRIQSDESFNEVVASVASTTGISDDHIEDMVRENDLEVSKNYVLHSIMDEYIDDLRSLLFTPIDEFMRSSELLFNRFYKNGDARAYLEDEINHILVDAIFAAESPEIFHNFLEFGVTDFNGDINPEIGHPYEFLKKLLEDSIYQRRQLIREVQKAKNASESFKDVLNVLDDDGGISKELRNEYINSVLQESFQSIKAPKGLDHHASMFFDRTFEESKDIMLNAMHTLMYHRGEILAVENRVLRPEGTKKFLLDNNALQNIKDSEFFEKHENYFTTNFELGIDDLVVLPRFNQPANIRNIIDDNDAGRSRKRQVNPFYVHKTQSDINTILQKGLAAGFKASAIRDYMMNVLGFSATDIDRVIGEDLGGMPESFANIEGGKEKGEALFEKILKYRAKLIKKYSSDKNFRLSQRELNEKTAEYAREQRKKYDSISKIEQKVAQYRKKLQSAKKKLGTKELNDKVGEYRKKMYEIRDAKREEVNNDIISYIENESFANSKKPKRRTDNEIMDDVLDFLEQQPEFKAEADMREMGSKKKGTKVYIPRKGYSELQVQMISQTQKYFGVNPTKAVSDRLQEAREVDRQRRYGKARLIDVQKSLIRVLRSSLPKALYKNKEVIDLIKLVSSAKDSNIESVMLQVSDFVTKKNVEIVSSEINSLLNRKYSVIKQAKKVGGAITPEAEAIIKTVKQLLPTKKSVEAAEDAVVAMASRVEELEKKSGALTDAEVSEKVSLNIALTITANSLMEDNDPSKLLALTEALQNLQAIVEFGSSELKAEIEVDNMMFREFLMEGLQEVAGEKFPDLYSVDKDAREKAEKDLKDSVRKAEGLKDIKNRTDNYVKKLVKTSMNVVDNFLVRHEALYGLVDRMIQLPTDIMGGELQKRITDRVDDASLMYKRYKIQNEGLIKGKLEELFGKKYKSVMRRMRKNETVKGLYKNEEQVREAEAKFNAIKSPTKADRAELDKVKFANMINMAPEQMYYWYNQYKDPANHASFANEEMFGSLENAERVMKGIEKHLETNHPKLKEFADWQVNELFPSLYDRYNNVYRAIYKTNMPWNMFYAGRIYRDGVETEPINLLGDVKAFQNAVTAASTKVRRKNNLPIKMMYGTDVLSSYLSDMEYFYSHAETVRQIDRFLKNPFVKRGVVAQGGADLYQMLNHTIEKVANRGKGGDSDRIMNAFNDVFIFSRLALSPVIMLKQLTSVIAYADDIGYGNWVKQISNVHQLRSTMKEIRENSVYLRDRMNNSIFKAIDAYEETGEVVPFIPNRTRDFIIQASMFTTKYGDAGAIYMGGAPNYLYYKKQFMSDNPNASEQEAIDYAIRLFERDTKRAQQSGDYADKDYYQSSNPFVRSANMFLTTPRQYMRKEMFAVRNLYRKVAALDPNAGSGTVTENVRMFVTYHVLLPVLFQYVANGLPGLFRDWRDEDEEDLMRAAIVGNLNAFIVVGEMVSILADYIQGKPWAGENSKGIGVLMSFMSAFQKLKRADSVKDYRKKKQAEEEALIEVLSIATPARTLYKGADNYGKLIEGDFEDAGEAMMRALNYSEYQISGPEVRRKKAFDFEAEEKRYRKQKAKEQGGTYGSGGGYGGGYGEDGYGQDGYGD